MKKLFSFLCLSIAFGSSAFAQNNVITSYSIHYTKLYDYGSLFLPDRIKNGYHVEELRDGVYWVSGGWYDCMFVRTGNGVISYNFV